MRQLRLLPGRDERYNYYDAFSGKRVEPPDPAIPIGPTVELRSVVQPAIIAVANADAIEATFDQVVAGSVVGRIYAVWIRPRSKPILAMIVYRAPAASFDEGLGDAKGLVRRFVLD